MMINTEQPVQTQIETVTDQNTDRDTIIVEAPTQTELSEGELETLFKFLIEQVTPRLEVTEESLHQEL